MSGLLSDVLPYVFRTGDWMKKRVNSLLSDPVGDAKITLGLLGDSLNSNIALQKQAYGNPKNPMQVTDKAAYDQMMSNYANMVMNFAPIGMTKVVSPSAEAMETARKNAIKMLGLPENHTAAQRASALGFDADVYHGTGAAEKILKDRGFSVDADARNVGGVWTTADRNYAEWIAKNSNNGSVIPLKIRDSKKIPEFDIMKEASDVADNIGMDPPSNALEAQELLAGGMGWDSVVADALQNSGKERALKITNFNDSYHSDPNDVTTAFVTADPSRLRLPNAAFDPARINENDLLGRSSLPMLGLLGIGSAAGSYFYNQKK